MCHCTPEIRTPCCGKSNCHPSSSEMLDSLQMLKAHLQADTEPRHRQIVFAGIKVIADKYGMPAGTAFVSDDVMCRLIALLDKMGAKATMKHEKDL